MNKVLVKISYKYGKGDGEELEDLNTENISEEERKAKMKKCKKKTHP